MRIHSLLMGLGGILGAAAVAMGAYAAHGLAAQFGPQAAERAALGAQYQMLHALCLTASAFAAPHLCRGRTALLAAMLFAFGSVIFPGALYALSLGGPSVAGAVAPLGGIALIAGWLAIGWAGLGGLKGERRASG